MSAANHSCKVIYVLLSKNKVLKLSTQRFKITFYDIDGRLKYACNFKLQLSDVSPDTFCKLLCNLSAKEIFLHFISIQ